MSITVEQAIAGTKVIFDGIRETIILSGHYTDEELGLMVKTSLYPGGMPATKFTLPGESDTIDVCEQSAPKPTETVTFEVAIIGEKESVKITPALIREKSKVLTDLTIANIFDDKGYEAVKKALSSQAVKTRTAIEKKEKEVLKDIKTRHTAEIKGITDYTASLYLVCREVEKNLQDKLTLIDEAKSAESKRLDDEQKAKTEGRDNKMFELGLTWNGLQFVGYGKAIAKEYLYSLTEIRYFELVGELEGLQMEQGVTGEVKEQPVQVEPILPGSTYMPWPSSQGSIASVEPKIAFENSIYDKTLSDGTRIVLSRGELVGAEGAEVWNDNVALSKVFISVFK